MKKLLPLIMIVLMALDVFTQERINIPESSPAVIDGIISKGEWDNTPSVDITLDGNKKVTVFYKRDEKAFYFMFAGALGSYGLIPMFPEVVLDLNNTKTAQWQSDDWWFQVSATDCYSSGKPDQYDNCKIDHDGWKGIPNFSMNMMPDTIEMMITFDKVKLNLSAGKEIGIGFMVNNTQGYRKMWPESAGSNSPATWATAVLEAPSDIKSYTNSKPNLEMYPNPAADELNISFPYSGEYLKSLKIVNILGKTVLSRNFAGARGVSLDISGLPSGIYYVEMDTNTNTYQRKLLVE